MGATIEEFKRLPGTENVTCDDLPSTPIRTCFGSTDMTYAGQHVITISADFIEGRLAKASVSTFGGSGEIIQSALKSRYGKPTRRRQVPQTMKNGNTYKMVVTEWRTDNGGLISIEDHPTPQNTVYTSLTSAVWLHWQSGAAKAGTREKQDL